MKAIRLLLMIVVLVVGPFEPASADGGPRVHSGAGASAFVVQGVESQSPTGTGAAATEAGTSGGRWMSQIACSVGGQVLCRDPLRCSDGTPVTHWWFVTADGTISSDYFQCPHQPAMTAPPQITQALVLRALRKVDLPASELKVQPPGGETLVNFRTNFFTDQGSFTRSVRLLGRRVDLKIWPSRFRWRFGDGAELASSDAGAPYPDLEITHVYESRGRVSPSVDTTYAAQFRVDGGRWRDVDGTVTIAGSPVGLRVRTARPVLVSYH